jgi:hypothetical protein
MRGIINTIHNDIKKKMHRTPLIIPNDIKKKMHRTPLIIPVPETYLLFWTRTKKQEVEEQNAELLLALARKQAQKA